MARCISSSSATIQKFYFCFCFCDIFFWMVGMLGEQKIVLFLCRNCSTAKFVLWDLFCLLVSYRTHDKGRSAPWGFLHRNQSSNWASNDSWQGQIYHMAEKTFQLREQREKRQFPNALTTHNLKGRPKRKASGSHQLQVCSCKSKQRANKEQNTP